MFVKHTELLKEALKDSDVCKFLIDGFPRDISQIQAFEQQVESHKLMFQTQRELCVLDWWIYRGFVF